MKLFTRKPKLDSQLPPEIQAYAQAERRERVGMAWLVGIISLVVTVLVLALLFFGGRWLYRKIAGTESSTPTTTTQRPAPETPRSDQGQTDTTDNDSNQTDTPVQAPVPVVPSTGADQSPAQSLVQTGPDEDL